MSVTAAQGFRAAGVTAGLKASGTPDVAVVVNEGPRRAAAASPDTIVTGVEITRAHGHAITSSTSAR